MHVNGYNPRDEFLHMGHRDQDRKKVDEMSLFFQSEKLVRTDKSKQAGAELCQAQSSFS